MAKKPKGIRVAATAKRKLKIVAEGDSWEKLPNWGAKGLPIVGGTNYDLCRALEDRGHSVKNLAYWGDTIEEIDAVGEYIQALRFTNAPILLLGGGGNDLLSGGKLKEFLRQYVPDSGFTAKDYILPSLRGAVRKIIGHYDNILNRVAADPQLANTRVVVHGYDYARPMSLGWLGEPLDFRGFDYWKADLRTGIIKILIDNFNSELAAFARSHPNVIYVDFRNRVGDRWHDELHPRKEAFIDLARYWETTVNS